MENNLENKAKFFAQYWMQRIFKIQVENCPATQEVNPQFIGKFLDDKSILELKSLSSITNEDADKSGISKRRLKMHIMHPHIMTPFMVDYLRSKGYALPWMGLSVEKQIEYGWIKLIS